MKIAQILMNKSVYLGWSILGLSKTVIYGFWYDYLKSKYGENVKLCYSDTDSIIVYVETDHVHKDIAEDVETLNYEVDKPWAKRKSEKVIGIMKDGFGGQTLK